MLRARNGLDELARHCFRAVPLMLGSGKVTMRGVRPWLLALVVGGSALSESGRPPASPDRHPPRALLYVGNSFFYFNDGVHRMVSGLLDAEERHGEYRSTSRTRGGASLSEHDVEAYLTPVGVASPSAVGGAQPASAEVAPPFDAVIMADCSQCPVNPKLRSVFHEYARKHSQTVVKHGARPILFMTWAYADRPEITALLAEQYTEAGRETGALVVPAGLAFARSIAANPRIDLYNSDKRHPSVAGSYLSACTILLSVYGKSPVGNPYTAGLDHKTAEFLQQIAKDTVNQYLGQ